MSQIGGPNWYRNMVHIVIAKLEYFQTSDFRPLIYAETWFQKFYAWQFHSPLYHMDLITGVKFCFNAWNCFVAVSQSETEKLQFQVSETRQQSRGIGLYSNLTNPVF